MAIFWILASFFGVVGIAWFSVITMLSLVHLRESKAPAILSAVLGLFCLGFTFHAAEQVSIEYEKIMESVEQRN